MTQNQTDNHAPRIVKIGGILDGNLALSLSGFQGTDEIRKSCAREGMLDLISFIVKK